MEIGFDLSAEPRPGWRALAIYDGEGHRSFSLPDSGPWEFARYRGDFIAANSVEGVFHIELKHPDDPRGVLIHKIFPL